MPDHWRTRSSVPEWNELLAAAAYWPAARQQAASAVALLGELQEVTDRYQLGTITLSDDRQRLTLRFLDAEQTIWLRTIERITWREDPEQEIRHRAIWIARWLSSAF